MPFRDRSDAGRQLAALLGHLREKRPVVLGLPRGGVPVAYEVARALGAPLDVVLVRKLGVPFQPELGMGALGEGGVRVLNDEVIRMAGVTDDEVIRVEESERMELDRRAHRYRGDRPMLPLEGHTAIVVDDGIATGSTARAALRVVRAHGAARVVLAVPVAPPETARSMADVADEVVCVETPEQLWAIGAWYRDFSQTTDEEVVKLLTAAAPDPARPGTGVGPSPARDEEVIVPVDGRRLAGHLTVPVGAVGLVVFAHGSGSSRHSPRNRLVASTLNEARLGTLLFDLLTEEEALDRGNVFDIPLLAARLAAAVTWLGAEPDERRLAIGAFGASTGAAAALWAAGEADSPIAAVVSRGGRPDLAGPRLAAVWAPTLLIVGGADTGVLDLNRDAAALLRCEHRLEIVPGATHLFEEPGALEAVAALARDWLVRHLSPGRARP